MQTVVGGSNNMKQHLALLLGLPKTKFVSVQSHKEPEGFSPIIFQPSLTEDVSSHIV